MLHNIEGQASPDQESKNSVEYCDVGEDLASSTCSCMSIPSLPASPNSSRPTSMVIKKVNTVIPAHLVAAAMSTLHGLDLRWSGPITPTEMEYVEQYVFARYPEYSHGLVDNDNSERGDDDVSSSNNRKNSPKYARDNLSTPPSYASHMSKIHLDPSKLLDILDKKALSTFISIPEIQARNRALQGCGLAENDYCVVFSPTVREAMVLVGESYPFFRGNYYLTALRDDDAIREFATGKESKVVGAPEAWLDLRIKGSQLSQYFRRKCKHVPKGLFAYPACANGARSTMHWISEAHRNSWHVLLDATELDVGKDERMALALHRPDFVVCVDVERRIVCLLVRKDSFETLV
ncbi:uncharacterized protein LOC127245650 [Andrographis paniculata]|uniref:uncharacterized protein LOC127245650 n=1 Tax=Andrographis paniculata TaxID=175694 RepID=UPI0021E9898E|nr:uncharacterized protein LOC127245650 [Andrographis paniculata]